MDEKYSGEVEVSVSAYLTLNSIMHIVKSICRRLIVNEEYFDYTP